MSSIDLSATYLRPFPFVPEHISIGGARYFSTGAVVSLIRWLRKMNDPFVDVITLLGIVEFKKMEGNAGQMVVRISNGESNEIVSNLKSTLQIGIQYKGMNVTSGISVASSMSYKRSSETIMEERICSGQALIVAHRMNIRISHRTSWYSGIRRIELDIFDGLIVNKFDDSESSVLHYDDELNEQMITTEDSTDNYCCFTRTRGNKKPDSNNLPFRGNLRVIDRRNDLTEEVAMRIDEAPTLEDATTIMEAFQIKFRRLQDIELLRAPSNAHDVIGGGLGKSHSKNVQMKSELDGLNGNGDLSQID